MLESLLQRFAQRDRLALSRLLSLLARGEHVEEILAAHPTKPPATSRVVAVTGSGGVGKSTLIGKLIERFRDREAAGSGDPRRAPTVAVLACDPESPLSGGALLGDRFRMPSRPEDDGVFIRSLAAASGQGPLARHLAAMVRLLEAFGFDLVVLETAGAGQGDTAVRELADVLVLLLQPETGDDLQWEKAGLLEVADIVAIHKADLPGADSAAAQVRAALDLAGARPVPVIRVSAKTGEGIEELVQAISESPLRRTAKDGSNDLLHLAQEILKSRFARADAAQDQRLQQIAAAWRKGDLDRASAGAALLKILAADGDPGR
jgi:LAO/AO transport system kinase